MKTGYFNATQLIPLKNGRRTLKPAHFLDNIQVRKVLDRIGKKEEIKRGYKAETYLPDEIRPVFETWLLLNKK